MRSYLPVFVLAGSVLLTPAAFAKDSTDPAEILKIEQNMAASQTAAQATATWDKAVVFDDMVAVDGQTSHYIGLDAARNDLTPQFAAVSDINTKIVTITVDADSDIGFAFSTQHLTAKGKNGAPDLDFVFRETDCFHKVGGKWVLVHQQLSVPFDPKTGKAVFESK